MEGGNDNYNITKLYFDLTSREVQKNWTRSIDITTNTSNMNIVYARNNCMEKLHLSDLN